MTDYVKLFAALPVVLASALVLSACGGERAPSDKAQASESKEKGEKGHSEKEGEGGHEAEKAGGAEAESVTIPAASAQASGIKTSAVGPGSIQETLNLTGRIMLQPVGRSDVHAPYPGPVRAVTRNVGDRVRRGETLARVESAESLQTYSVTSPIAGVVLERQTNVGDVTGENPLFVIGDLSRLQAELNVVTRDVSRVASGQSVIISGLDGATRVEGRIETVLPSADARSQSLIARALIPSSSSSELRPGMAVRGSVVLAEKPAAITVRADAVQSFEGRSVVFVRTAPDTYEARAVILGRAGRNTVEITSGLVAGEAYVSENAFVVKAEIGKGAASH